jgi:hypothetical protein
MTTADGDAANSSDGSPTVDAGLDHADVASDVSSKTDVATDVPVEASPDVPVSGNPPDAPDAREVGGDVDADADAAEAGGDSKDAGPVVPPCDLSKPYGNITLVRGLESPAGKYSALVTFSPDELTAYFGSNRGGATSVYVATRGARTAAFLTPSWVPNVNKADTHSTGPTVTADGLTMYFETFRSLHTTIWVSKRDTTDALWSLPVIASALSPDDGTSDGRPYVSADGKVVYFHSSRVTNTSLHIMRAEMGPNGFGKPVLASVPAYPAWDVEPVVSSDDLTLFYGSNRSGDGAQGGYDIWSSHRASTSEPFPEPVNVKELNTTDDDMPSWISPDSCRFYFEHRNEGTLYVASKPGFVVPER